MKDLYEILLRLTELIEQLSVLLENIEYIAIKRAKK